MLMAHYCSPLEHRQSVHLRHTEHSEEARKVCAEGGIHVAIREAVVRREDG